MSTATATVQKEQAQAAIARHASDCVEALRLADFLDTDSAARGRLPGASSGIRRMAQFYADHAWAWVPTLRGGAA